MTRPDDDGIVVLEDAMSERQSVHDYLTGREEMRPMELVWGRVCEPPAPRYGHQSVVTRTVVLLDQYVRAEACGSVCVAPLDVILDARQALIVQPDIVFVSNERAETVRDQVWGAPDLVVEVLSSATRRRDRTVKWRWYRQYGIREYWLIDPVAKTVTIAAFGLNSRARRRVFRGARTVESTVLGGFRAPAAAFFD